MTNGVSIAQSDKIAQAYRDGWSFLRIRVHFQITRSQLESALIEEGVEPRKAGRPGLTEREWERRRRIAARIRPGWGAVRKYCQAVGAEARDYLTAAEKAHGVVIGGSK